MNLSLPFIERPVMTTLVIAAMVIFGGYGYANLPVSDLPNVDFPTISVMASLPGADPDTMASSVATPLENQFSTIQGIDQMTSTSTQGQTMINLQFSLDRTLDGAAQDVQSAISAAASFPAQGAAAAAHLPQGKPRRPARHVHRHAFRHREAVGGGRICRNPAGAAALDAGRRGPGQRLRQRQICRAHPGRS